MRRDRPIRAACALIALAAPLAVAASAAATAATAAPPSASAPLELVVNGASRGTVDVVLRDGDALVAADRLQEAGLRGLDGHRTPCELGACVSLASLAPALRFVVDEELLALRVTAEPELLGAATIDLRPSSRPPELRPRGDPSAFLNYSVLHSARRRASSRTTAFAEAGASEDGRLVYSSMQLLEDGTVLRDLSSLTLDDEDGMRRFVVGDAFATSTQLGGGVLLGGLSVAREFSLDPYLLRAPMPQLTGFAATPSTLDVYANGVLTRQVQVQPGRYDLTNVPVAAGAGTVETVLRDAFGRTETLSVPYYHSAGLLAPGLADYGYSAGFRRRAYGRRSFEYGSPVLVGRHRLGVTELATLGGRLDVAGDLASGGPSATVGLPFGTVDLEAAASIQDGSLGAAGSASYGVLARGWSGGARVRALSSRYAHAALRPEEDRASWQSTLFAGAQLTRRVNLDAAWSLLRMRDTGRMDLLSVRTGVVLGRNAVLSVTGTRSWMPAVAPTHAVFAMLSWAFAPLSMADVAVDASEGRRTTATAGVQRGLPAGNGVGYRARGGSGPQGQLAHALLQGQWDHGRVEAQYDRFGDQELAAATVAGGVVLVGERVFFTRPVQQGYALLRLGVPGVRGYAEGQEIGRTDGRGDLFVPQLTPYYGNRLAIADQDIPIEYRFGRTEVLAAPTLRGAVVTRFDVTLARAAEGELFVAGVERPPAYGELHLRTADGTAFSSPVGADGRFFVEDAPAGTHLAEVEWSGGRCQATLVVPRAPPIAELGRVACEPLAAARPPEVPAMAPPAPVPAPGAPPPEAAPELAKVPPPAPVTDPVLVPTNARARERDGARAAPSRPRETRPPGPQGYGPRSTRCPSCAVCLDASLRRTLTPTTLLRCVDDLAAMNHLLDRAAAKNACLAKQSFDELCAACQEVRRLRQCPAWP